MTEVFAAAIFDLDGTLIDTERPGIEAGLAALASLGFPVTQDFLLSLIGIDAVEGQRRLHAHVGPGLDMARLDAEWRAATHRAEGAGIPTMAGAVDLLTALDLRGLPRAVATNSETHRAIAKLGHAGLALHFDAAHVVGYDSVARAKPAPDVFLEAADRLKVPPARCVAFEDSDTGVAAALEAGMTVVQVPDMVPASSSRAHHLAPSLLDGARACGLIR